MTFRELYDEWYRHHKTIVKHSTWVKIPKMMKHIRKVITDDILIRKIDITLIRKITDGMYTFGDYSLNYTEQTKTTLSAVLPYAVNRHYIKENPALKVTIQPKKSEEEKHQKQMAEKFLEANEVKQILDAFYSSPRRRLDGFVSEFLYLAGLRFDELQALQIKDYDGKAIDVNGTLDYTYVKMADAVKTTPKNVYSNRVIELPNRAIEIIDTVISEDKLMFGDRSPDDFIFLTSRGTPISLHAYNGMLRKLEKELDFPKTLSSHIFRHSHISLLSELNVPLKAIMERVGHNDAQTTLSIYNHVTQKSKQQLIDKLNQI